MGITTLSMILTVFVLNLHHITDRPVPPWIKRLCFIYIARMIGMCGTANEAVREQRYHNEKSGFFRQSSIIIDSDGEERTAIFELRHRPTQANTTGGPESAINSNNANIHMNTHALLINSRPPKLREGEPPKEDYAKDWKKVAEVFDRLFFWLFLLAIFISTMVLFHPLTKSYTREEGIGTS